ncbi:hypothetical protein PR003_g2933 [Phytophthora rubi]|uniref:Retrotransposon gag domain-containing protein n=1 Tax=Phytophthora rubi TaxID=129364 RepID=A0A6A4G759_9STRA|nr:hypothetical protein PR003_g2933 [Phytophthora rubi]
MVNAAMNILSTQSMNHVTTTRLSAKCETRMTKNVLSVQNAGYEATFELSVKDVTGMILAIHVKKVELSAKAVGDMISTRVQVKSGLNTQEYLHDLQLPHRLTNALLFQHLRGVARQWYVVNIHELRPHSFEYVCGKVKSEFRSKLSHQQIMLMVASERKKHAETYREYSLRLRAMAAAVTTTGLETIDSNNAALSLFIVNAWYKHTDNLRRIIRDDSDRSLREIYRAINKLCSIAGH